MLHTLGQLYYFVILKQRLNFCQKAMSLCLHILEEGAENINQVFLFCFV